MPRPARTFAPRTLILAVQAAGLGAALGCADAYGLPGEDDDALPLMRSLAPDAFGRSVRLEVRAEDGWLPTGIVPPVGSPVRLWNDHPRAEVERRGGALAPTLAPGAVLLRQGARVWSADRGLALYAPGDEELWIGINAPSGFDDAAAPVELTIAWGQPVLAHAPGLEVLAVAGSDDALAPWLLPADGSFVTVGSFDAGARLRVVAERVDDGVELAAVDGGPGSEPGPDPGTMAKLLPGEFPPALRFPGLWSEGIAYRIDGELVGQLPVGGVVHLPDGGELSLAANGGTQPGAQAPASLAVGLEPLPRLGVELATLPRSAFVDARATVEIDVHTGWASTGIEVLRGDVVRVEGHGVWRGVPADPLAPAVATDGGAGGEDDEGDAEVVVGAEGLLVRAPEGDDWLVPAGRILAPHVRIGEHRMAVPASGVFVAPTDGLLQVGTNGCRPGAEGGCAESLAETEGTLTYEVGWLRALEVPEVD